MRALKLHLFFAGEYITIYQYQRQQQKQNLAEKEKEMLVLAAEREILREKLAELQLMVAKYIQSRSSTGGVGEGPSDLPSGPEAQTWLEGHYLLKSIERFRMFSVYFS